jgi:hypothetical protein
VPCLLKLSRQNGVFHVLFILWGLPIIYDKQHRASE